jgi:hypothetical protein
MLASTSLLAEALVKVNAMNYPVWVERSQQIVALLPGSELRANDLLRTGKGGRVLLQLADGSALKLGGSASFRIESASMSTTQDSSYLQLGLEALRGAFRFTSSFFGNATAGHRVNVRIGAITAGVRGTDIWGRSNLEKDLVCLIEGAITVDAAGESTAVLEQALSFYVKPKGAAALPVEQVDPTQLQLWAAETELDDNLGVASLEGSWQLVLMSLSDANNLQEALQRFNRKGFAAQSIEVQSGGKTWHRLLLPGFVSRQDALNARIQVAEYLEINDAWVWRAE